MFSGLGAGIGIGGGSYARVARPYEVGNSGMVDVARNPTIGDVAALGSAEVDTIALLSAVRRLVLDAWAVNSRSALNLEMLKKLVAMKLPISSEGLRGLKKFLDGYTGSDYTPMSPYFVREVAVTSLVPAHVESAKLLSIVGDSSETCNISPYSLSLPYKYATRPATIGTTESPSNVTGLLVVPAAGTSVVASDGPTTDGAFKGYVCSEGSICAPRYGVAGTNRNSTPVPTAAVSNCMWELRVLPAKLIAHWFCEDVKITDPSSLLTIDQCTDVPCGIYPQVLAAYALAHIRDFSLPDLVKGHQAMVPLVWN